MAIEKGINPMNQEPFTVVTGTVKKISFFEAKNNKFATHNASILVDETFVKMGLTVKEGFNPRIQYVVGKKPNEKWETLKEGDIVRIMISKESEYQGKPQYQTTSSRIFVTGHEEVTSNPTPQPQSQKQVKLDASLPAGGAKIFGEVKSKENGLSTVSDENSGKDYIVDLSDHPEVEVGHKMTAFVSPTGEILNQFKHYPPKQSNGKKLDAYGSPERNFKMAFGNMVNVAAIALPKGSEADVFNLAQRLFSPASTLRDKLLAEFKGVRDESDVGGKLGDALKHSAEHNGDDVGKIINGADTWFHLHIDAENEMKELLEGKNKETEDDNPEPYVSDDMPDVDFDEEIPF